MRSYSSIYSFLHPEGLCFSKEVGLFCWQHKDSQLSHLSSSLHFGNAGMSLCPSEQWHSVFSGGPHEMHSSSSRQGRGSVQRFPVFCHFVALFPLICSLPRHCSILNFTIIYTSSYASIHSSFRPANNPLLLSRWCVLSQQHLIQRHVMVRRHQSWKTWRKQCDYCMWAHACVCFCCVRVCRSHAQQNAGICPLQVKMEADLFPH